MSFQRQSFLAGILLGAGAIVLLAWPLDASSQTKKKADAAKSTKKADPKAEVLPRVPGRRLKEAAKALEKADRIRPGDRLRIEASNTPEGNPIHGFYRVERSGKVPLGLPYGRLQLKGLTLEEAELALQKHLAGLKIKESMILITRYDPLLDPANRLSFRERLALSGGMGMGGMGMASAGMGMGGSQYLEDRIGQLEDEVRSLRETIEKLLDVLDE